MGKNMAVIESGTVMAVNWYADREEETDSLAETKDRPVDVGDSYADGRFYRNGEEVLSEFDIVKQQLADAELVLDDALDALDILGV